MQTIQQQDRQISIQHTPSRHDPDSHSIVGPDVETIVAACKRLVRRKSVEFYRRQLREDLEAKGKSLIDRHAGGGNFYAVYLEGYAEKLTWPYGADRGSTHEPG